ncbi:MAG: MBL fold metallo-hydrolase [Clostridia bacterium]|nr:MBL fold metallo-hydrolase [Clostridia bacterium]
MRIRFLGTSHGVPEAGRFNSSAMIEVGSAVYYVDAGAPIVNMLVNDKRHPSEVRAIFITHCHGDHINMLPHFVDLCHWYYLDADFTAFVPETNVIENIYTYVESLKGGTVDRERERLVRTVEGVIFEDENIRVTAIPTCHLHYAGRPSFAYRIEADGKSVVFTGDLSGGLVMDELDRVACSFPSDVVILEKAHYSLSALLPYLERMQTKELWFNHVNSSFDELLELDGKYPFRVKIANDNDEIIV